MIRQQQFNINGQPLTAVFGAYRVGTRTVTTCELAYMIDDGVVFDVIPLSDGASICMPGDNCQPVLGEKKALAAAMNNHQAWSREMREQAQEQLEAHHANAGTWDISRYGVQMLEPGYGAGV